MRLCRQGLVLAMLCATAFLAPPGTARAESRIALVIGNGAYQNAPKLPNPANDAKDVAASLSRAGFEVISGSDMDRAAMEDAAVRFSRAARQADVAMFYYSGHALQYGGVNFLAPVDAKLADEADLRRMVRVDDIVGDLEQAKNLRILVLDACRDNPFADTLTRSMGATRSIPLQRGLAPINTPKGMIVSFATQAGHTAADGVGRNSPYTVAFLKHIDEPEEIGTIFRRISYDVYESTDRVQLPELSLSLIGEFYLHERSSSGASGPDPCASAEAHWKSAETIGTIAALQDHISRFPGCAFVGLARARVDELRTKEEAALAPTAPVVVPEPTIAVVPPVVRYGTEPLTARPNSAQVAPKPKRVVSRAEHSGNRSGCVTIGIDKYCN